MAGAKANISLKGSNSSIFDVIGDKFDEPNPSFLSAVNINDNHSKNLWFL